MEEFQRKLREEEIKWIQRSRCKWSKEGDKNTRFFHEMASLRQRTNRIYLIIDWQRGLEKKEEIISHIEDFFRSLYADESWERPTLDNMAFDSMGDHWAQWLERMKFTKRCWI